MPVMLIHHLVLLNQFSSAGGGGSSSGGGGDIIGAISYFPSFWIARFIKKRCERRLALIITATSGAIISLFIVATMMGVSFFLSIIFIIGLWTGWYAGMFDVWDTLRKKREVANQAIVAAAQTDGIWNEATMHQRAQEVFMRYQQDWSQLNSSSFAEYMSPQYAYHSYLMVRALHEMHRLNQMQNVAITKIDTIDIYDDSDNAKDSFTVLIEAQANDALIDSVNNTVLYQTNNTFIEAWRFVRSGSTWVLDGITPSTADYGQSEAAIASFAAQNNMYYSIDWGRLLVPHRGQLFKGKQALATSDINNHLIGVWNDILVQMYTYRQPDSNNSSKNYFIMQISLPKTYGGIVIRRKKGLLQNMGTNLFGMKAEDGTPYQKYEFEWPDFNSRYEVFATDQTRLAAFELLNPGFMAYLYDTGLLINIEVVDNSVYLYEEVEEMNSEQYPQMLEIMAKAFKELKL